MIDYTIEPTAIEAAEYALLAAEEAITDFDLDDSAITAVNFAVASIWWRWVLA